MSRSPSRLEQLDAERLKLLQAHYADAVALDLLRSEQDRISRETANARARLEATAITFVMIDANLRAIIALSNNSHTAYRASGPRDRRTLNQAFFEKIYVDGEGTVTSDLAEPFATLLHGQPEAAHATQNTQNTQRWPRAPPTVDRPSKGTPTKRPGRKTGEVRV